MDSRVFLCHLQMEHANEAADISVYFSAELLPERTEENAGRRVLCSLSIHSQLYHNAPAQPILLTEAPHRLPFT